MSPVVTMLENISTVIKHFPSFQTILSTAHYFIWIFIISPCFVFNLTRLLQAELASISLSALNNHASTLDTQFLLIYNKLYCIHIGRTEGWTCTLKLARNKPEFSTIYSQHSANTSSANPHGMRRAVFLSDTTAALFSFNHAVATAYTNRAFDL